MAFSRAAWHSGLTYRQTCTRCKSVLRYTDKALDFRPWFADGFIYCPKCKTPLRHNENYAINAVTDNTTDNTAAQTVVTKNQVNDVAANENVTSNNENSIKADDIAAHNAKFCTSCGHKYNDDDVFCSKCGQKR
ncbi:MAG: zinc ribbon domain-containing protein [Clostridia bacterium]|nr:zinc ribbon domain-containing protein [Clostridia bacterium]